MDLTTEARARILIEDRGDYAVGASTFIGKLVTLYSYQAEEYLRRTVTAATYTEHFNVRSGQAVFQLKAYPISAVSAVYSDSSRSFDSSSLISSDDYTYDPDTGTLFIDKVSLPTGPRSLKIVYVGGMATNTTAFIVRFPEVSEAIDMQIAYHWNRRSNLGENSVSLPDASRTFTGQINWLAMSRLVLDKHRRMDVY